MITEEMIKRAKAGDKYSFQKLYEEIYKDMYRMAYYLLQNREDAEDAVSEAVYDMYKGIGKLKQIEAFKAWAMKILSVKCKVKMKEYSQKRNENIEDIDCDSGQDIEGKSVLKTDMMKAIGTLSEEEQMIVVCTAVAGMSSEEVGKMVGLKSPTVRTKLRRALAKLKERLEAGV